MNPADFHFIRPYWLLALMPQLAILVLMLRNKLSQGDWSTVCDAALLPYLLQEKAVNRSRWPLTAGAVAALLAIIALAGPTWERLPSPVFRNDSALVIALDLSRSMDAGDIKPSRLIMARIDVEMPGAIGDGPEGTAQADLSAAAPGGSTAAAKADELCGRYGLTLAPSLAGANLVR